MSMLSIKKLTIPASILFVVAMFIGASSTASAAVVIQYHHISEETPKATSISPALFAQHMAYLYENDYQVVALEDLVADLKNKKLPQEKTIAITFDDGYRSVYSEAFPILKKYAWPFTVFVNTKPIQQNLAQFVSWGELREMAEHGATIANHSFSHPHFLRLENDETEKQWRERITREILSAEKQISDNTGQAHRLFAHPYGETNSQVNLLLSELKFVGFGQQSGPLSLLSDLATLPRFPFGGPYGDIDDFKVKVASLPFPMEAATLTINQGKSLSDGVLPLDDARPVMELHFNTSSITRQINCFASGQGEIPVVVSDNIALVQAPKPLPVGRSRYNCTSVSNELGRFYWYSQLFIRRQANGEWYYEP